MAEQKFTPGPWEYKDWGLKGPQIRATRDAPEDGGWRRSVSICTLRRHVDVHSLEANARLIAKAPEMYEALKEAINQSQEQCCDHVFCCNQCATSGYPPHCKIGEWQALLRNIDGETG